MLRKMVKYDIMFGSKNYGVLFLLLFGTWISGLVVSLIGNIYLNTAFFGLNVVMSIIIVAAYVITSLQFFYNALSGDESYFNYTVPTNTVSLVFSKLASIWMWGGLIVGALSLTWVSLYFTLLKKMGMSFSELTFDTLGAVVNIGAVQAFVISCALTFAISLCNTPKMKSSNLGILAATVIGYGLTQLVALIQFGITGIFLLISGSDIVDVFLTNGKFSPVQEIAFLDALRPVMSIVGVILAVAFFCLTVRTVGKKRSI